MVVLGTVGVSLATTINSYVWVVECDACIKKSYLKFYFKNEFPSLDMSYVRLLGSAFCFSVKGVLCVREFFAQKKLLFLDFFQQKTMHFALLSTFK
jgi:hypothetical protein